MIASLALHERLLHFDLLEDFEAAVRSGHVEDIVQVLLCAQFTQGQALQGAQLLMTSRASAPPID